MTIVNGDCDDDCEHDDGGSSHDASNLKHNVELFFQNASYATISLVGKNGSHMMRHFGEPGT